MNPRLRLYVALILLPWAPTAALRAQSTPEQVIASVRERAEGGDVSALRDLRSLPQARALRVLELYTAPTNTDHPELRVAAAAVMADMKVEGVYGRRLAEAAAEGAPLAAGMEILQLIKTKEAVRIIGSYLDDDRQPTIGDDDVHYAANSVEAAAALGKIGFADAPTQLDPDLYRDRELKLWREWWEANRARF